MHATLKILIVMTLVCSFAGLALADSTPSAPPSPDSAELIAKAERHLYMKNYGKALPLLKKAEKADPENADVHNLLGYTHRNLGNTDQSMKNYTRALDLDPDHVGAHEYMGELFLKLKQPEEAQRLLDRLSQICGNCEEYSKLKAAIDAYSG